jgi:hypothetical protein
MFVPQQLVGVWYLYVDMVKHSNTTSMHLYDTNLNGLVIGTNCVMASYISVDIGNGRITIIMALGTLCLPIWETILPIHCHVYAFKLVLSMSSMCLLVLSSKFYVLVCVYSPSFRVGLLDF